MLINILIVYLLELFVTPYTLQNINYSNVFDHIFDQHRWSTVFQCHLSGEAFYQEYQIHRTISRDKSLPRKIIHYQFLQQSVCKANALIFLHI